MNAKVLTVMMFALLPSAALAQSERPDQKPGEPIGRARHTCGQQRQWLGREWRVDPGRRESDANATTAPSSKPPAQTK